MNRFTADGLIDEALDGKRVLVLDETAAMCNNSFHAINERLGLRDLRANRWASNGQQAIAFGIGGRIDLRSIQSNLRGVSADIVLVNHLHDRRHLEKLHRSGDLYAMTRYTNGELVVE